MKTRTNRSAFTIVELMVTIGVIALLVGLLLPGLGMVRATANATKSQSNLRQWGIGTIAWAGINEERLPWEGLKEASHMATNLAVPQYWANAIPPMVGQQPYKEISESAFRAQKDIDQFSGSNSVFVDPAAKPETMEAWGFGQPGACLPSPPPADPAIGPGAAAFPGLAPRKGPAEPSGVPDPDAPLPDLPPPLRPTLRPGRRPYRATRLVCRGTPRRRRDHSRPAARPE